MSMGLWFLLKQLTAGVENNLKFPFKYQHLQAFAHDFLPKKWKRIEVAYVFRHTMLYICETNIQPSKVLNLY